MTSISHHLVLIWRELFHGNYNIFVDVIFVDVTFAEITWWQLMRIPQKAFYEISNIVNFQQSLERQNSRGLNKNILTLMENIGISKSKVIEVSILLYYLVLSYLFRNNVFECFHFISHSIRLQTSWLTHSTTNSFRLVALARSLQMFHGSLTN